MADSEHGQLGLDLDKNALILQSKVLTRRIVHYEKSIDLLLSDYIKIWKNTDTSSHPSINARVQDSIQVLRSLMQAVKTIISQIKSVASDTEFETHENNCLMISELINLLNSREFTTLHRQFINATLFSNNQLNPSATTFSARSLSVAYGIRSNIKDIPKHILGLIRQTQQYIAYKQREETLSSRTARQGILRGSAQHLRQKGVGDFITKAKRGIESKVGIDRHDSTGTRARKIGGLALGGLGFFAAAYFKSPALAVGATLYLKKRQDVIEKNRELYKKRLNDLQKQREIIQDAARKSIINQSRIEKSRALRSDGFISSELSRFGGGTNQTILHSKKNQIVVGGDNPTGKELINVDGQKSITNGLTAIKLDKGSLFSAKPIGPKGTTVIKNPSSFSKFGGGTGFEDDDKSKNDKMDELVSIAQKQLSVLEKISSDNYLYYDHMIEDMADQKNRFKGGSKSESKIPSQAETMKEKVKEKGLIGAMVDTVKNRITEKLVDKMFGGFEKMTAGNIMRTGGRMALTAGGAVAGGVGGYKLGDWGAEKLGLEEGGTGEKIMKYGGAAAGAIGGGLLGKFLGNKFLGNKDAPDVQKVNVVNADEIGEGSATSKISNMFTSKSPKAGGGLAEKIGSGLGSIGKGIGEGVGGFLQGLAKGLSSLGNPKVMAGAASLILLGGALWTAGKGLQTFQQLDWGTIAKGTVAIGALALGAAALSSIAIPIAIGSAAIAGLGLALRVFPAEQLASLANIIPSFGTAIKTSLEGVATVVSSIGSSFTVFSKGISDLSQNTDAANLAKVAGSMMLLAPAMVAFAGGMAAVNIVKGGWEAAKGAFSWLTGNNDSSETAKPKDQIPIGTEPEKPKGEKKTKFLGWFADGGSFEVNSPSILGVGESGPETVTVTPKNGITGNSLTQPKQSVKKTSDDFFSRLKGIFDKQNKREDDKTKTQEELLKIEEEGQTGFLDQLTSSDNPLLKGIGSAISTAGQAIKSAKQIYSESRDSGGGFIDSVGAAVGGGTKVLTGKAAENRKAMEDEMTAQGITDPKQRAVLMGQFGHETAGFAKMEESKYSAESVWKLRGNQLAKQGVTLDTLKQAQASGGKDAMYEYMYGGRLGNTDPGDAAKYKGRGHVQLTGKSNYADMTKRLQQQGMNVDLIKNPELAADPKIAAKIGILYAQKTKGVMEAAKAGDVGAVSRGINAGNVNSTVKIHGMEDRQRRTNLEYAGMVKTPTSQPVSAKQKIEPVLQQASTQKASPVQQASTQKGVEPVQPVAEKKYSAGDLFNERKSISGDYDSKRKILFSKFQSGTLSESDYTAQSKALTDERATKMSAIADMTAKAEKGQWVTETEFNQKMNIGKKQIGNIPAQIDQQAAMQNASNINVVANTKKEPIPQSDITTYNSKIQESKVEIAQAKMQQTPTEKTESKAPTVINNVSSNQQSAGPKNINLSSGDSSWVTTLIKMGV